jgi:alkanesulfonate monooxygenase SsuD/methylene tetrahydromethanopterin reductase-like flavin-dependent oxidoreductase (luciferase family)
MPPLMIGGGGRRVLGIAAREADIVALVPQVDAHGRHRASDITGRATAEKIGWIRKAAGERAERIEIQGFVVDVDIGGVAAWAKRVPFAALDSPYFLYGSTAKVLADLERRRERLGITYYPIPDRAMENFAPVVAAARGR